jgi:hypothetical protein
VNRVDPDGRCTLQSSGRVDSVRPPFPEAHLSSCRVVLSWRVLLDARVLQFGQKVHELAFLARVLVLLCF